MLAGHVTGRRTGAILGGGSAVHLLARLPCRRRTFGRSVSYYDVIPSRHAERQSRHPWRTLTSSAWSRSGMGQQRRSIRVRRAFKQIFEGDGLSIRANAAAIRDEYFDKASRCYILDFIAADSDRALSSPNRNKRPSHMEAPGRRRARGRASSPAAAGCCSMWPRPPGFMAKIPISWP